MAVDAGEGDTGRNKKGDVWLTYGARARLVVAKEAIHTRPMITC